MHAIEIDLWEKEIMLKSGNYIIDKDKIDEPLPRISVKREKSNICP
jgi:hypothetical protein